MSATLDDVIDATLEPGAGRRTPPCTRAYVADTIAFSDVDGPGNRFVVFLQGCNFDCIACHNQRTRTANLALDTVDANRVRREPWAASRSRST